MTRDKRVSLVAYQQHQRRLASIQANLNAACALAAERFKAEKARSA